VTLRALILDRIPRDPLAAEFRQGNTLGRDRRHWFQAKFGGNRFRLFFRADSRARMIMYAWVNDRDTLRKAKASSDPYAVFARMLAGGNPPHDWPALLAAAQADSAMQRLGRADIVPPHVTAVPSETAETAPTQRDRHLQHIEPRGSPGIAEHGRMVWQKASGYTRRALAEAAIGRWKQVIGDGLRAHTDERRATEVDVAVYTLNRMLDLGRPNYVRTA